jgi:hypothetical protein
MSSGFTTYDSVRACLACFPLTHLVCAQMVSERLLCLGCFEGTTKRETVLTMDITANFITPVVQISRSHIDFSLVKDPGSLLEAQQQTVTVQNISPLALTLTTACDTPFQATPRTAVLSPSDSLAITVLFDPLSNSDKQSRSYSSHLTLSYAEHPQCDQVPLNASVSFANIAFPQSSVDFGCIPNGTKKQISFDASNPGPIPAHYSWSFVKSDDAGIAAQVHRLLFVSPYTHGFLLIELIYHTAHEHI